MSLKSKAELQITHNRIQDIKNEIDYLTRQLQDKKHQIKTQGDQNEKLQQQIREKMKAIH